MVALTPIRRPARVLDSATATKFASSSRIAIRAPVCVEVVLD